MSRFPKTSRFPRAFAERNKVAIALIGSAVLVLIFLLAFNAKALPVIGNGGVYTANFAEAGGLKPGDQVRVAGIRVGEVSSVSLDGKTVVVTFRAKGVDLHDRTTAAVKIKTLLGEKYLAIDPQGTGELQGPIPKSRTSTPYDVSAALQQLSTTFQGLRTKQLEKSFQVLSDTFAHTPKDVRATLQGLTALSRTISTHDTGLKKLLRSTSKISGTLQDHNAEIARIINDGNDLLDMLQQRRQAVTALLKGTAELGTQVRGLVRDNQKQLQPALTKLDKVAAILQANQHHMNQAIRELGPYYKVLASAMGNGRWVDSYICGLFNKQDAPLLKNDVARDCHPGGR